MNEQQQELYEKLLKKVNEFCLGQAAEDVIEAIDNLVDNYECERIDNEAHATLYSEAVRIFKKYQTPKLFQFRKPYLGITVGKFHGSYELTKEECFILREVLAKETLNESTN